MSQPRGCHRAPSRVVPLHAIADVAAVVPLHTATLPDAVDPAVLDVDVVDPAVLREMYRRLAAMYRRGVECSAELAQALDKKCEESNALARRLQELEDRSNPAWRLGAARMASVISQSRLARLHSGAEPYRHVPEAGPS